jgi:hypothetical protein
MTTNSILFALLEWTFVKKAVLNKLSMTGSVLFVSCLLRLGLIVHPLFVAIWRFSSLCIDKDCGIMDQRSFFHSSFIRR